MLRTLKPYLFRERVKKVGPFTNCITDQNPLILQQSSGSGACNVNGVYPFNQVIDTNDRIIWVFADAVNLVVVNIFKNINQVILGVAPVGDAQNPKFELTTSVQGTNIMCLIPQGELQINNIELPGVGSCAGETVVIKKS